MSSGAAVNVPTNFKIKEQDVNNKLQLYGIYSAFANGKVPSNKQIDIALNSVLASKALSSPSKKLSQEGQHLVADLRRVIEEAKILLLTKNEGNLLQDFIWQTQHLGGGNASTPNAPIDKNTAKQHGNQALDGLRTLGTLLISNGQFRKLLNDAQLLARDIAGDAAQKAAHKVNPDQEALEHIDEPAEDNTWHDTPDLSRDGLKQAYHEKKPFSRDDVKAATDKSRNAADQGNDTDAKHGARQGLEHLKGAAKQNVPDEDQENAGSMQDKAREKKEQTKERTGNYLKSKMPQERREQTIWRLKKMIAEIQGHSDYQQAIETLLNLAEEYAGHSRNLGSQSAGTVKGAHSDDSLRRTETDLKTLLERFANSTSFDDLFDSINQIYADANNDPRLKSWFERVNKYIRRCLQEQGYVLQDSATDEWNQIYDEGQFLLRDRYREHTDRVLDEVKFAGDQFDKDPQNRAFGDSMQKLFTDLGQDENGKPAFKPHLLKDLSEVIIPAFFENIRYVPIPRIEYSDPMIDCVVENLVIEGDNLAPNVLEFGSDNYWRWGRRQISNKNKNKVMLSVSGVQCDLRDVSYYVNKKEGFPSVHDKGIMDVVLAGSGLSFKVAMETADKMDRTHFFKVNTVDVQIKNMNIILKKSNHKLLFKIFKPLLMKVMVPVIQKVVEKQVRDNIHQLDAVLYQIHQNAERAQQDAKNDPNPQNVFSRYANGAKDYVTKTKNQKAQQAKEKSADKQVNVAVNQRSSLFPNVKLPGGISTKATEYKELAEKGEKWESPIFTIGSARESTNLPKIAPITRKRQHIPPPKVHDTPRHTDGGSDSRETGTGSGYGSSGNTGMGSGYGSGTTGDNTYGSAAGMAYEPGMDPGSNYDNSGLAATSGLTGSSATGTAGVPSGDSSFGNQVDMAFRGQGQSGAPTGEHQGTTLGKDNPVWSGRA
ncbi:hypothetical protein MBLNU457_5933t1 [Dothideomycetes sp. NU457]